MDISDYASKIAVKAIYIVAEVILDIILDLLKKRRDHLQKLEQKGEKPYLTRSINRVQSLIDKREINKIDLQNAQLKSQIKDLDSKIEGLDNNIKGFELQEEKRAIEEKISLGYDTINELSKENKDIAIDEVRVAINQYESRINEIDNELDNMGVREPIDIEKYNNAIEQKKLMLVEKNEKQTLVENGIEKKLELKEEIEALLSKNKEYKSKDIYSRKKDLQEELDVINRKINYSKENNKDNHSESNKEVKIIDETKKEEKYEIKNIKEQEETKNKEKNETDLKKEEIVPSKVALDEKVIKKTKEDIQDTYIKLKKLAIENPDLKNNEEYKSKIEQAEKLMNKYNVFEEYSKNEKIKEKISVMER